MDFRCPDTDWSALAVAPAYSQLAGVLAGFVFTGIVLLLTQRSLGILRVRTLSLFFAAFFVLALDSYQWGLMAGDNVDVRACNRIWTEAEIASGLLGLGAVAIINGVGWLLAAHLQQEGSQQEESQTEHQQVVRQLEVLCRFALYSMAAIVALLLGVTGNDYLKIVFMGRSYQWTHWLALAYPVIILGVLVFLRRNRGADVSTALKLGALGSITYAAIATAFLGSIVGIPAEFWV
ncbi:hypothetical protein SMC26_22850 [Actinomadura fulvescens]|uniref:Uncharacterized protein n=1 Tax=Actinomadura fulvescens TaxID=46160 RepID=A0ABN3QYQ9_9ACTN